LTEARRAPAARRGGTACQMVQRRAGPFFSAVTLFYNYELRSTAPVAV